MSGPYNPLYMVPPLRIPGDRDASNPRLASFYIGDWIQERYEILNADMRNAWTHEHCFSDNTSAITFVLLENDALRALPDLDRVSWQTVIWWDVNKSEMLRERVVTEADGTPAFALNPDFLPEAWHDTEALAETAAICVERLKDRESALMEHVRRWSREWAKDLDYAQFLPPDRQAEVGEMLSEDVEEVDDEIVSAVGASVFATLAWHARRLIDDGAESVLLFDTAWKAEVELPVPGDLPIEEPTPRSGRPSAKSGARRGWLSRLFGR